MTFEMHWVTAVQFARQSNDVTYEEWCELYYDHEDPTDEQIQKACDMAYTILLRNEVIAEDPMEEVFLGLNDEPEEWPRRDDPRPPGFRRVS